MLIKKDINIDELIELVPESVNYLMKKGIHCIACGEPVWGTLEQIAKGKGYSEDDIQGFIQDLQKLI